MTVRRSRCPVAPRPRGPVHLRAVTAAGDEGRAIAGRGPARRPSSRHGRRVLRRRRLVGLLRFVVFLFFIFVAVWAGVRVAHAGTDATMYTGHQYVVQRGDTLWGIASREYGDGANLRRAVFEIRRANRLQQLVVQPGEDLTLPYLGE